MSRLTFFSYVNHCFKKMFSDRINFSKSAFYQNVIIRDLHFGRLFFKLRLSKAFRII